MYHNSWAEEKEDDHIEENAPAQKACDTDDPIEHFLYDPPALCLAKVFIWLGWSANQVSILSLVFGVCGSFFLYPHDTALNITGIVLEITAAILDCSDGMVARLTKTSSQLGRVIDGAVDIVVFFSMYISVGLRTMEDKIPFTETGWSYMVFIVLSAVIACHVDQARMADYFKGAHLTFIKGMSRESITLSEHVAAELSDLDENSPRYEKAYLKIYLIYTRLQERSAPKTRRLLEAADRNDGHISPKAAEAYTAKSHRYMFLINTLTFNVRAYTLFAMLLCGRICLYFVFVIIALEGIKRYMIRIFENIAGSVYEAYFDGCS